MNEENKETNSPAPEILPMKRKRGRPRKDERPTQGKKASDTPGPETVKRNRQRTNPTPCGDDVIVGQVVSGVLDGKFEAGYLLSVKVGDGNTVLRGAVFEPGKSAPVSGANDVAPHINMLRRNDIALPVVDLQVPMHGSTPQSEQKQPAKVLQKNEASVAPKVSQPITQVPKVATQVPSHLQTKPVTPEEVPNDTNHVQAAASQALQQAENKAKSMLPTSQATELLIQKMNPTDVLPEDKAGLPQKVLSNNNQASSTTQQAAESEIKPSPSEHSKTVEPAVVLAENKASSQSESPRDVQDASKVSRLEPETEPSVDIVLPSCKTINDQVAQVGSEAVGSELKPDMQIDNAAKNLEPKSNLTTVPDPSLKHDMQIDNAAKSLEAEPNLATVPDESELEPDMQIDDAAKSLKPEPNLATMPGGSELELDMQIDDAGKRLEPEPNLTTVPDGSELKPDMQFGNAAKSLEPEPNLTTVPDRSELKPDMQIGDAAKSLEPEFIPNGSELRPDMQIDNAAKSMEPEANLTTVPDVSELKPDQQTVDEPKDRASEIDQTPVDSTPALASQNLTGLQKSKPLQDTEAKYSVEIERAEEVPKCDAQSEPTTNPEVEASQREAILGARNGLEEEVVTKPSILSKDAPEFKTSNINVPTKGEEVVDPLVQAQSSVSESNNDTDSLGGTNEVHVNQTQV